MRKLASIQEILAIDPIPGADSIEVATIQGWKTVVSKDQFAVGEYVAFFEIDSWMPASLAPFLSKGKEPREYKGVKGERLRTIKLRGQISQGLVLKLDAIGTIFEGNDLTEFLGIQKWEREVPANLRGQVRGNFPTFIPKTDQERRQNLVKQIENVGNERFEVTLKLDGTSFTAYHLDGAIGLCSRNLELKPEDESTVYAQIFRKHVIGDVLAATGMNVAIQGEIMGSGVQGNREGLTEAQLFVFDVFDIDQQTYLDPLARLQFFELFLAGVGIKHAPVLGYAEGLPSVATLLQQAEGPSLNHPVREGLVYKSCERDFSFKVISNKFLMDGND